MRQHVHSAAYEIAAHNRKASRMRAAHRRAETFRRNVSYKKTHYYIHSQQYTAHTTPYTAVQYLYNCDQFDVENEHAGGGTGLSFISEVLWNPEASFFAFDHELDAFGPTGDDLIEIEFDGLAANDAGIEHFSVSCPAGIMHAHAAGTAGMTGSCAGSAFGSYSSS